MPFTALATRVYKDPLTTVYLNSLKGNDDYFITGVAKAWVSFDGSAGALSAQGSHNISSIADGGIGVYRITLTTGFQDTGYVPLGMSQASLTGANRSAWVGLDFSGVVTTNAFTIKVFDGTSAVDTSRVYVAVMGLLN